MTDRTFNQRLQDDAIRHQIGILRFSSGLVDRVLAHLEAVEKDLSRQLTLRLGKITERGYDLGPASTRRLRFLLASVREHLSKAYGLMGDTLKSELYGIAKHEVDFQVRMMQANTPFTDLKLGVPSDTALRSIVTREPMRGRFINELIASAERGAIIRAGQAIRLGLTEGETMTQIRRRVMGSGGLGIGKRGIAALTRTAVNHATTRAREMFYAENADIVQGVRWVSTLDNRTTPICQRLDGEIFKPGEGERPPAHIQCRSTTAPILDRNAPVFGQRASQVGAVPAKQTYGEWLRNQPSSFQDDVLGATRGRLFRDGGLSVDRFVDIGGRKYTLAELRIREARAFDRAGL